MTDARALVVDLATGLRQRVLPALGGHDGRAHARAGAGGDVTFAIDEDAERFLEAYVAEHAPTVAFYSEDRGLVEPARPAEHVLVVDPIDGTRPALAGLEAACVSVALAPLGDDGAPTMGDVAVGAVVEIKSGASFVAQRGRGLQASVPVAPSPTTDLSKLFWVYGLRGRPARPMMEVLGELVDRSSVGGAVFDLGAATFDMTRVATGQLDAYVEPGGRMVDEVPGMQAAFATVGGGHLLNNSPYDVAAAALVCSEAGVVVTDASGRTLDDRPLLAAGAAGQMSMLVAANPALHAALLAEIDAGIARLGAG